MKRSAKGQYLENVRHKMYPAAATTATGTRYEPIAISIGMNEKARKRPIKTKMTVNTFSKDRLKARG
jgi:hypothetical protein